MSDNPEEELDEKELRGLIDDFEGVGVITFDLTEVNPALFDAFTDYTRRNNVPLWTQVDRENGIVTFTKRFYGTLE